MKKTIGTILVVGAVVSAFALGQAQAQDPAADAMKAWIELAKPGPQHEALKKMAGDWEVIIEHTDPMSGKVQKESGSAKYTMVMGGRILQQEFTGAMNGQKFTGIGYTGFNNGNGKHESIWMDDMSTGIFFSVGTATEDKKAVNYKGHYFGPNAQKINQRVLLMPVDDDTHKLDIFMDMGMGEMKTVSMTYKRKK